MKENASRFEDNDATSSPSSEGTGTLRLSQGTPNSSARERRKIKNGLTEAAIMQLPEEKLAQSEQKAKLYTISQEADHAIVELVRCIALTRICYGDQHWKLAKAYTKLAQGYLQLKGLALQANAHAAKAKEVILVNSHLPSFAEEKKEVLTCLVAIFHVMAKAFITLQKWNDAEKRLAKADKLLEELWCLDGVTHEEVMEMKIEVTLSSARLFQKQKKPAEAVSNYLKALSLLQGSSGEGSTQCAHLYRDLATAEQAQGDHDSAIQHLLQAHSIVMSQSPASVKEAAQIAHSLAQAYASFQRPAHNDLAEKYYEESVNGFKDSLGSENAKCLMVQDDYCKFLILIGNQEKAATVLKDSLQVKKSTFGDLSAEVAETYRFLGGIELAQGNQKAAYKHFTKCLDIQTLLYGPQHRKTKATQQTVALLLKAPEVNTDERKVGSSKERLPF